MRDRSKNLIYILKKYKFGLQHKFIFAVFATTLSVGLPTTAQAGIFDDIGDAIGDVVDDVVDGVKSIFSSAKNVAETVVDKVDTKVIANITGRCTMVKAENDSGDTETVKLVEQCGHSITELEDVFQDAGGEIAKQAKNVKNTLVELPQEQWENVSGDFADAAKTVVSFFEGAIFDPLVDVSEDLLDAMSNVEDTLSSINFPLEEFSNGTNVDLTYTIPLGGANLEIILRGLVSNNISSSGLSFASFTGSLKARLKSIANGFGYAPQVMAQVSYDNPIIKFEDGKMKGIFVLQPEGSISMGTILFPLQFSAGLGNLLDTIPGLKKLPFLNTIADSVSFDADIGTVYIGFPLTNQENDKFNMDVSVSGGVDAVIKLGGAWRAKIAERVSWDRNITFNAPAIQLPIGSIPAGVIGKIESDSKTEPSYAKQIVSYTFEATNTNFIEDKSGHGNHAYTKGGVTLQQGAAFLNGTDGYIDLPDDIMKGVDEITVYAEVNVSPRQEPPYFIYGLGNTNGDRGDGYLFTTGDEYRSVLSGCHWICEQSIKGDNLKLPRSSWQKLVYTVKGNVATLYLNGDIVSQKTDMTLKPSDIGGGRTTANYIGRSLYSADNNFRGAIRNFQIWNGALTQDEVAAKFGNKNTITVHVGGKSGYEKVSLVIDGSTLESWTVSKSMKDYTFTTAATGKDLRVAFTNDAKGRDVRVDYIKVNGKTYQAEDQADNTGVWANGKCGGGTKSEWLGCNGSIGFGNVLTK